MKPRPLCMGSSLMALFHLLCLCTAPLLWAGQPPSLAWDSPMAEELSGADPFAAADAASKTKTAALPVSDSPFHLGGFLEITTEVGFNKDQDKLSSLRPLLSLEMEYRAGDAVRFRISGRGAHEAAYELTDRNTPGHQGQDDEEWEGELWEAYADVAFTDRLRLKAGRQIISWGESNYARLHDFINPRDMTRPGLMELEDSRMPITALRLTADTDWVSLEGVSIHEFPGDKISGLGGDFDAFAAFRRPGVRIVGKDTPDTDFQPQGFAFKAGRTFNGADLALVAGRTYDASPVLVFKDLSPGGITHLSPEFEKMTLAGLSANYALDNTLFKLEGIYRWDRAVQRKDIAQQVAYYTGIGQPLTRVESVETKDQTELLVGLEYTGVSHLVLLAEAKWLHTLSHESSLALPRHEYRTYVQANYLMWNDTLDWEAFWVHFNPGRGHILRLSGEYAFTDHFSAQLGVAFYDAGNADTLIYSYKDMDRIFCRLTYFF